MNACMHRDYQSNMPIRIYQFSNSIEILVEAYMGRLVQKTSYGNIIVTYYCRGYACMMLICLNRVFQRVKKYAKENGNPDPIFNVGKVTGFRGINIAIFT